MKYNSEQPIKIAVYARAEPNDPDPQNSIAAQFDLIALACGRTDIQKYEDSGHNGVGLDRPGLRKLLEDAKSPHRPFDVVIIPSLPILSRNSHEFLFIERELGKNGISVESLNYPTDRDAKTRQFEINILKSMAQFASEQVSEQVKRGQQSALHQGFYIGAQAPFGYRKNIITVHGKRRCTLEIMPQEAEAISAAFDLAKTGKTPKEIATELNERNLPAPRGAPWTSKTVRTILKNEIYTGTISWGKNQERSARFEGLAPVIVARESFMMVQQMLNDLVSPNPKTRNTTSGIRDLLAQLESAQLGRPRSTTNH